MVAVEIVTTVMAATVVIIGVKAMVQMVKMIGHSVLISSLAGSRHAKLQTLKLLIHSYALRLRTAIIS